MKTKRTTTRPPRAGFTMMELVLVLLSLLIIAAIAMPRFGKVQGRTQDSERTADLESVQAALEAYKQDHGSYPAVEGWRGDAQNYGGSGYGADGYVPGLVPDYLQELPRDPDPSYPGETEGYLYKSNGKDYKLIAHKTPSDFPTNHRFYDPKRRTWAYQVSSRGGRGW